jgi:transposase
MQSIMISATDPRGAKAVEIATNAARDRRVAAARAYDQQVRAETSCAECGAPMADWHNPEHIEHPGRRVARLVGKGYSISVVAAEIAASTPLCRRCHMEVDGRLHRQHPNRRRTPRKLTDDQVQSIREKAALGTATRTLSVEYGVTVGYVRRLVRGGRS